jgi:hypothetical protein
VSWVQRDAARLSLSRAGDLVDLAPQRGRCAAALRDADVVPKSSRSLPMQRPLDPGCRPDENKAKRRGP